MTKTAYQTLIKIAYENPELRAELLPVIMKTGSDFKFDVVEYRIHASHEGIAAVPAGQGHMVVEKIKEKKDTAHLESSEEWLDEAPVKGKPLYKVKGVYFLNEDSAEDFMRDEGGQMEEVPYFDSGEDFLKSVYKNP